MLIVADGEGPRAPQPFWGTSVTLCVYSCHAIKERKGMGRRRLYASATERQRAHLRRKQAQESVTARLIALQEDFAHTHVDWARLCAVAAA